MNSLSRQKILIESWNILKGNPFFIIGFLLFIFLISIAPNFLLGGFDLEKTEVNELPVTTQILIFVVQLVVSYSLIRVILLIIDKKELTKESFFPSNRTIINFTIGTMIYDLAVFILFYIIVRMEFAGVFVFIIFIYLALKFQFISYIIIDKKTNAVTAFKISNKITRNEMIEIFLFIMSLLLINILGAILFFVGLLVTMPVSVIAIALLYRDLIKKVSFETEG